MEATPSNNQFSENYLLDLNSQQRDAVEYLDGPSLVIAGAGSGKTRVLTYKIVHLLNNGFEPWRIMALTFTNKAAREMKERVAAAVGNNMASRLWMGTFHSVFLRILRQHSGEIGYSRNFTIYDASDTLSVIKQIIKDLALDDKQYKPSTIASVISYSKNSLIDASRYASDLDIIETDKRLKRPMLYRIYQLYESRCRLADAMDFDDILFQMNVLLRDHPQILEYYQEFFRYILVDEYQDTNFSQHLIISQLSKQSGNICVVGDDAQSIYSFRGANISNILNLNKLYPNLRIFKLERNYRSTQNIINAAGSLIEKNSRQIKKNVYSENSIGNKIEVVGATSDLEESFIIANSISRSRLTNHDSFDDYAILYRVNAQSRILEESLRKRNIPYRIYGGLTFYQRKEVKDTIAYFRLSVNPDDDEALRRIINFPKRGIGETTVKKIRSAATDASVSMIRVLSKPTDYKLNVNSGTLKKLESFYSMISEFVTFNKSGRSADELAKLIYMRTGLLSATKGNTPESVSQEENLKELLKSTYQFVQDKKEAGYEEVAMSDYLSEVCLATDQDSQDDNEAKVTLMTVHAAKGLEFDNVYVVGVEEDLFPASMSKDSLAEIEEERRLLYVAITRAKLRCTLTYTLSRFRNGATQPAKPSRFLSDIDSKYIIETGAYHQYGNTKQFTNPISNYWRSENNNYNYRNPVTFDSTDSLRTNSRRREDKYKTKNNKSGAGGRIVAGNLENGMRISHSRFGNGTIIDVENVENDPIIIVDFDNLGQKRLLLRFANIEVIG